MGSLGNFRRDTAGKTRPQLVVLLLAMLLTALPVLNIVSVQLVNYGQDLVQPARALRLPPHIDHDELLAQTAVPTADTNDSTVNCRQVSCLALTFDDGPNPLTTPQVLNALEQAHIHATFFMVGTRIAGNEGLLQRMHADGDEIGNHSWTHPDMTKLTVDQVKAQVQLTQQAVVNAGVPPPTVFRPPYGFVNQIMERNIPLSILLWNEDPKDWAAGAPQQVVQAVEASAQPGGIVDMHDIYRVTADALPRILTDLSGRGYHFVTVDQLLNLSPASRGIYYGRLP